MVAKIMRCTKAVSTVIDHFFFIIMFIITMIFVIIRFLTGGGSSFCSYENERARFCESGIRCYERSCYDYSYECAVLNSGESSQ